MRGRAAPHCRVLPWPCAFPRSAHFPSSSVRRWGSRPRTGTSSRYVPYRLPGFSCLPRHPSRNSHARWSSLPARFPAGSGSIPSCRHPHSCPTARRSPRLPRSSDSATRPVRPWSSRRPHASGRPSRGSRLPCSGAQSPCAGHRGRPLSGPTSRVPAFRQPSLQ